MKNWQRSGALSATAMARLAFAMRYWIARQSDMIVNHAALDRWSISDRNRRWLERRTFGTDPGLLSALGSERDMIVQTCRGVLDPIRDGETVRVMVKALILGGGGPLAVAWEAGFLAGVARRLGRPIVPDFILGTSAGAIVGAQIAGGRDPRDIAAAIQEEATGKVPPGATRFSPEAIAKLPEFFAKATSDDAERVKVGTYARHSSLALSEAESVARMQRLVGEAWPEHAFAAVAVDVATGEPCLLGRDCGGTLAAAVAASCSLPGVTPVVSIAGRSYMDGGLRSATNADLPTGFERVVVLCFHPSGPVGERVAARLAAQVETLRRAGTDVLVFSPDAPCLAEIGLRTMDVMRRPAVVGAGVAQGTSEAERLAAFWAQ